MLGTLLYLYRTFDKGSEKAPYMDLDTIATLTLCKTAHMHECTQTHGAGLVPCVLCPLVFTLSLIVGKNRAEQFSSVWKRPCFWPLTSSVTPLRLLFEMGAWRMQRGWVTTYRSVANSNCVAAAGWVCLISCRECGVVSDVISRQKSPWVVAINSLIMCGSATRGDEWPRQPLATTQHSV